MTPLISVVIPVYNRNREIASTVSSVLDQTLDADKFEILIVDDGSTDNTPEILRELYGNNDRIRLFFNSNSGVASARNFGLKEARGEFIAYLDHDDLWLPTKLEKQLNAIRKDKSIGVVYSNWEHFDLNGTLPAEDPHVWEPKFEFRHKNLVASILMGNFIISMSVPLIRTAFLRQINGFDPKTVPCDDWDLWIRMAEISQFVGIQEKLVRYRQHDQQQSKDEKNMWIADFYVRRKNWRVNFRHPRTIPSIYSPLFFRPTKPAFFKTKDLLFESKVRAARMNALKTLLRHPLAALTPQWMYLIYRLLKGNTGRY